MTSEEHKSVNHSLAKMLASSEPSAPVTTSSPETVSSPQSQLDKLKGILVKIPALGILCSLLSGVFFATASVVVKLVTSVSPLEILTIRAAFQTVVFLPIVLFWDTSYFGVPDERLFLCFRVLSGTVASALSYYAFRLIPLGDATTIVFTSPVFVSLFGCILLKEPCGCLQVIAVLIALVGVFLISKPSFVFGGHDDSQQSSGSDHIQGIALACISCVSAALAIICLRKLSKTSASVIILWFSVFTVICGIAVLAILNDFRLPKDWYEVMLLLGVGVCGVFGQFLITIALKYEKAGPVALARTMDIVVAYIYQVALLKEPTSWSSIVGAVLISSGIIVTALHKWNEENSQSFAALRKLIVCCKKSDSDLNTPI